MGTLSRNSLPTARQPLCAQFRRLYYERDSLWTRLKQGKVRLLERPAADLITLPDQSNEPYWYYYDDNEEHNRR